MKEEAKTQKEKKPQSKGKKVIRTIINTIVTIMIVVVLIVSILIAALALTSKASGISTVFGYTVQPIQSDSMKGKSPDGYPSGDFEEGDLMIAKATDFDDKTTYDLGDIITYRMKDTTTGEEMLIVHRIVDVVEKDDGSLVYQTQGDNRETSPEPDQKKVDEYISAFDIGSVYYTDGYEGKILKGWGKVLDFLQSQKGFFFGVLLPMIIFFIYELIRVVMNAMNYKKAKADEDREEAVKAAVAAALASQNEENEPETNASEEQVSDPESTDADAEDVTSNETVEAKPAEEAVKMTAEQLEQFKQFQEFQKMQKAQQEQNNSEKE